MSEQNQPAVSDGLLLRERKLHPIVPKETVASTALIIVIAIMAFLASLTLSALLLINDSARSWQTDVSREVTIQVRPVDGIDMSKSLIAAQKIAQSFSGIDAARIVDSAASNKLLEPWLGSGLDLAELPIPRLVALTVNEDSPANLTLLQQKIASSVPGASLDNHRAWIDRLASMARVTVVIGFLIFFLVLSATVLTVVFATRGAMSGNQHVIEVLHFVGAERTYIASQFQKHFLLLGLKGSVLGGGLAMAFFTILSFLVGGTIADPASDQMSALFGSFNIGVAGYVGAIILIFGIALLTAFTSRITVFRHVGSIESRTNMTGSVS